MRLQVKITPLDAGTTGRAGPSEMLVCPADVEPETVRAFLIRQLGEPIEVAWTRTERHERLAVGWIFPARSGACSGATVELLCVPFIDVGGESLRPMFEVLADRRQDFKRLAAAGSLDSLTVVELTGREYSPKSETGDQH